jgi:hypothetical protein
VTTAVDNGDSGMWDSGGRLMSMVWRHELIAGSVYDGSRAIDGGQEGPGVLAVDNRLKLGTEDVRPDFVSHLGPERRQASVIAVVRIDQDREDRFDEFIVLSSVREVDLLSATCLLLGGVGPGRCTDQRESPDPLWCLTYNLERHVATHADPCECEARWCVSKQSFGNAAD